MNEQEKEQYRRELYERYGEKIDRKLQNIDYQGKKIEGSGNAEISQEKENGNGEAHTVMSMEAEGKKSWFAERENMELLLGVIGCLALILYVII